MVYVVDSRNNIGHPTQKHDMVRRLLCNGKAKIIKRFNDLIIIQLLTKVFKKNETIDCEFRIGIDPGYKYIGFALFKIYKMTITKLFCGEVETRTSEITKNLLERKMYRRLRRRYRRKNVLRKFDHVKFRKPIWKNRRKTKFQPTHIHLIDSHLNLLNKLFKLIPIDQSKIYIEYAKFDIYKIINSNLDYQKGIQYGYENVKSYIRHRDDYTCQMCKRQDVIIEVHHIIERSNGGSDRPDNLITLCKTCHNKLHQGLGVCPKNNNNQSFKATGVLNSCMKYIYQLLDQYVSVQITYGYITKSIRIENNISKSHANDASIIAFCDQQDIHEYNWINLNIIFKFKQYRRHVRNYIHAHQDRKYYISGYLKNKILAWNRNRRSGQERRCLVELKKFLRDNNKNIDLHVKPGKYTIRRSNTDIKFRPGDVIEIIENGKTITDVCRGWASTQYKVITENLGQTKVKFCQRIFNNSGMVLLK